MNKLNEINDYIKCVHEKEKEGVEFNFSHYRFKVESVIWLKPVYTTMSVKVQSIVYGCIWMVR